MKTLLLDRSGWDLVLDLDGNIAVASDPYSMAQDAASAIRTFLGECYYNTNIGVSYWNQILATSPPPVSFMKAQFEAAALTVPGIVKATCIITSLVGREVRGQVQITDINGNTSVAGF